MADESSRIVIACSGERGLFSGPSVVNFVNFTGTARSDG